MNPSATGNRNTSFAIMGSYQKALKHIGAPEAIRILAARSAFQEAWQHGESPDVLKARYDFKPVSSSERCRQLGNLYQIHMIRSYRALLCFNNNGTVAWWLDVFVKNESRQNRRIATACERALRLVEQHTP